MTAYSTGSLVACPPSTRLRGKHKCEAMFDEQGTEKMFGISSGMNKLTLKAIDSVTANLMIADVKLNIVHMNPATRDLLQEAESDLKKELPQFSMASLVGSNIDIFHKDPSHQRKMLAALKKRHRATITVGPRVFDLVVTPLEEGNKVSGFVVEWADANIRLANIDYKSQIEAIYRAQAVISFSTDGKILDANQNFLDALGYTASEIVGHQHSMLVDQEYAASPEYQEFWKKLRSGEHQAAEFVRYGKGGKRVVINASYNPIFDDKGRVAKVVKFATNVTERVEAVETIGEALTRMASGDLSFSIDQRLAPDFELLRENLNSAISQLNATLASVSSSADLIDNGSREISQSANDLSKRTEQQAASLEETAAALDEITVNVKNSSERTEEARLATEEANRSATHSSEIVANAVKAMAGIEDSSKKISNIIGVIDEIAFQTNLLALNAGVEAARAGEAGKGFAVVAQEVRELAQRSAQAAKEIKDLISHSSQEVNSGVSLVKQTGDALQTIQISIVSINEHMQAIASSSREQSTGISEVNVAVNDMDKTTQQNAAMVEETTAASATLTNETTKLREMIARFQINERAGHSTAGYEKQSNAVSRTPNVHAGAPKLAKQQRPQVQGNLAVKSDDWEEF